jgi:hypothetical protein
MWRWALLCIAVGLGVIVTRVFWDGRAALAAGDEAIAHGDVDGAVVAWRRAARWYAPGAPHVADAYQRLEAVAREAEAHGDARGALAAWRAIRSSVVATRSFYTPYADRLEAADERIAALMAAEEKAADPARDEAARKSFHLALLARDESPRLAYTVLALCGFAAWVGGGYWFARRGVTADDQLDRREALRAAALIVAGMAAWMIGLYWA